MYPKNFVSYLIEAKKTKRKRRKKIKARKKNKSKSIMIEKFKRLIKGMSGKMS